MNFFENSSSSKVWDLAESSMSLGRKKGNPTIFFFNERSSVRLFCSDIELVLLELWVLYQCIVQHIKPGHGFINCSWEIDGSHHVVET